MSWLDNNYSDRIPVAVLQGLAETTTVTIPPAWDGFWGAVESTGYDIRFTQPDGVTLVVYERVTWDYANKIGVFRLTSLSVSNSTTPFCVWMYYDYAAAADVSTAVAASMSPGTGYLYLGTPEPGAIAMVPDPAGATQAGTRIPLSVSQPVTVWFQVRAADLPTRDRPHKGSVKLDEPKQWRADVYAADGVTTSTDLTVGTWRLYESPGGDYFAGFIITGNTAVTGESFIVDVLLYVGVTEYSGTTSQIRKRLAVDVIDVTAT